MMRIRAISAHCFPICRNDTIASRTPDSGNSTRKTLTRSTTLLRTASAAEAAHVGERVERDDNKALLEAKIVRSLNELKVSHRRTVTTVESTATLQGTVQKRDILKGHPRHVERIEYLTTI